MQFILNTFEEMDAKTGSHILTLLKEVLEGNGYTLEYMEVDEMITGHPIGDNSLTEEIYFQSKITRKTPEKKRKGGNCSSGSCVMDE